MLPLICKAKIMQKELFLPSRSLLPNRGGTSGTNITQHKSRQNTSVPVGNDFNSETKKRHKGYAQGRPWRMSKTRKGKHGGEGEHLRRGSRVSKGTEMAGNKKSSQIT